MEQLDGFQVYDKKKTAALSCRYPEVKGESLKT